MTLAIDVLKILVPSATAFVVGIAITPIVTDFLYKHKMWKTYWSRSGRVKDFLRF
jgi:hypothetical protein